MNNKFKRALSSILAFVMVISVLTVMNVTTALAESKTYTYNFASLLSDTNAESLGLSVYSCSSSSTEPSSTDTYVTTNTAINSNDFTITVASGAKPYVVDYSSGSYLGTAATSGTLSGTKLQRGIYNYSGSSATLITISNVPKNSVIEVYSDGVNSKGRPGGSTTSFAKIADSSGSNSVTNETYSSSTPVYSSLTTSTDGDVTISPTSTGGSGTGRIVVLAIVITTPDDSASITLSTENDTITTIGGTTSVTNTLENIAEGSTTSVTYSSSDDSIATVASDGTVTAVASGIATITGTLYVDGVAADTDTIDITVDDGSVWVVRSAGEVNLYDQFSGDGTSNSFDIDDGTIINNYFKVNGTGVVFRTASAESTPATSIQISPSAADSIQFTTAKMFKVTVSYSSTGSKNVSLINIKDSTGNPVAIMQSTTGTSNSSNADTFTVTLPAGTYDIYNPGASFTVSEQSYGARDTILYKVTFEDATEKETVATVVTTIGDDSYVFFGVDTDKLDKESFNVLVDGVEATDSEGEIIEESTIYYGVSISGSYFDNNETDENSSTYISGDASGMTEQYSADAIGLNTTYVVGYKIGSGLEVKSASSYELQYNPATE